MGVHCARGRARPSLALLVCGGPMASNHFGRLLGQLLALLLGEGVVTEEAALRERNFRGPLPNFAGCVTIAASAEPVTGCFARGCEYSGSPIWPDGLVHCRTVMIAEVPSPRYFAPPRRDWSYSLKKFPNPVAGPPSCAPAPQPSCWSPTRTTPQPNDHSEITIKKVTTPAHQASAIALTV